MRVNIYGNTLNSGLILTEEIRKKGIDAILFLDKWSPLEQDYPWWDNPHYHKDNLPTWIRFYDSKINFLYSSSQLKILIEDFSQCDVALVSGYGPILARKAKVPYVFFSVGSDLNSIDFRMELKKVFLDSSTLKGRLRKLVKCFTYTPLQKAAVINAKAIIIGMGYQQKSFIDKFGLTDKSYLLPFPKDIASYGLEHPDNELNNKYSKYKVLFYMISRLSWKSLWNDLKGNDKFLRAYVRFVKKHNPNSLLFLPNKGIDIAESKKIVEEIEKSGHVKWMDNMPKHELKKFQSLPNLVGVDNFWHDKWYERFKEHKDRPVVGFGFGSLEILSSKRPLITAFFDHDLYDGEQPPIFHAFSEDEILEQLEKIYSMSKQELLQIGEKGYDFAYKWHERSIAVDRFIMVLEEVYKETSSVKN